MSNDQSIPPLPPENSTSNNFGKQKQTSMIKPKKKRKILLIVIGSIVGLIILCIIIASLGSTPESSSPSSNVDMKNPSQIPLVEETKLPDISTPTKTTIPTDIPSPTLTPSKTPNPNLITAGTYLVGTEIQPGLYKGIESGCYWERLKDLSGSFESIIANANSTGQFYVQVAESDTAFSTNCDVYLFDPQLEQITEFPTVLEPGQYLVGSEIAVGIYQGLEDGCYWERLKDLSGSFDGIITNDNTSGQFYVQLKESDIAFSISCTANYLTEIPQHSGDYPLNLQPGMYLIGKDIKPGTYKGQQEGCYWERLSNIFGDFNGIIANDNSNGQYYVQVNETDFALFTNCPIEWVSE